MPSWRSVPSKVCIITPASAKESAGIPRCHRSLSTSTRRSCSIGTDGDGGCGGGADGGNDGGAGGTDGEGLSGGGGGGSDGGDGGSSGGVCGGHGGDNGGCGGRAGGDSGGEENRRAKSGSKRLHCSCEGACLPTTNHIPSAIPNTAELTSMVAMTHVVGRDRKATCLLALSFPVHSGSSHSSVARDTCAPRLRVDCRACFVFFVFAPPRVLLATSISAPGTFRCAVWPTGMMTAHDAARPTTETRVSIRPTRIIIHRVLYSIE